MQLPALLKQELWFPNPLNAVDQGPCKGLLAIGGDLSVPRLRLAYRSGVFPWTARPITWWSPDPRGILHLGNFHVPRSVLKLLRKNTFRFTLDQAFRDVIAGCAETDHSRPNTWIAPSFVEAYCNLHEAGYAHSMECWKDDVLAGGIYGVTEGGLFAGESMFHRIPNASKAALATLLNHLRQQGFALFDLQMVTAVTQQFGAVEITRADYLERLRHALTLAPRFVSTSGICISNTR